MYELLQQISVEPTEKLSLFPVYWYEVNLNSMSVLFLLSFFRILPKII